MRNPEADLSRRTRMTGKLCVACLPMLLVGPGLVAAADADYLKLLDEEVSKVDGAVTRVEADAPVAKTDTAPVVRASGSRKQFEGLLREQHVGTYSFYRRLPERNRQEIFLDYQSGMPMNQLRDKIVDRFLHP